jgi:chorismate mutase
VAIDLRARMPEIPIVTDPSHMGGDRALIYGLSQEAMDLQFDGLMIESHIRPDEAWSDAKQQVTPDDLRGLLQRLVLRAPDTTDKKFHYTLDELRAQVDGLDSEIIAKLAHRMRISQEMGRLKRSSGITILQPARWDQIMHERMRQGCAEGLSAEFVSNLLRAIHEESIGHQSRVMNSNF